MRPAFAAASPLLRAARVTRACGATAPSAVLRKPPTPRREAASQVPAPAPRASRAAGGSAPADAPALEKPAEASARPAIEEPPAAAVAAGRARVEVRGEAGKVRLLWDSECPLCVREVEGLRAHAASKFDDSPVVFVDVADLDYDAAENGGVGYERAMGKIHAVDADGQVVEGVEVFRKTYEALGLVSVSGGAFPCSDFSFASLLRLVLRADNVGASLFFLVSFLFAGRGGSTPRRDCLELVGRWSVRTMCGLSTDCGSLAARDCRSLLRLAQRRWRASCAVTPPAGKRRVTSLVSHSSAASATC